MTATFARRWADAVAHAGERPFLVWEGRDGRVATWTYAEFDGVVAGVAGGLAARGVKRGAVVHHDLVRRDGIFRRMWPFGRT